MKEKNTPSHSRLIGKQMRIDNLERENTHLKKVIAGIFNPPRKDKSAVPNASQLSSVAAQGQERLQPVQRLQTSFHSLWASSDQPDDRVQTAIAFNHKQTPLVSPSLLPPQPSGPVQPHHVSNTVHSQHKSSHSHLQSSGYSQMQSSPASSHLSLQCDFSQTNCQWQSSLFQNHMHTENVSSHKGRGKSAVQNAYQVSSSDAQGQEQLQPVQSLQTAFHSSWASSNQLDNRVQTAIVSNHKQVPLVSPLQPPQPSGPIQPSHVSNTVHSQRKSSHIQSSGYSQMQSSHASSRLPLQSDCSQMQSLQANSQLQSPLLPHHMDTENVSTDNHFSTAPSHSGHVQVPPLYDKRASGTGTKRFVNPSRLQSPMSNSYLASSPVHAQFQNQYSQKFPNVHQNGQHFNYRPPCPQQNLPLSHPWPSRPHLEAPNEHNSALQQGQCKKYPYTQPSYIQYNTSATNQSYMQSQMQQPFGNAINHGLTSAQNHSLPSLTRMSSSQPSNSLQLQSAQYRHSAELHNDLHQGDRLRNPSVPFPSPQHFQQHLSQNTSVHVNQSHVQMPVEQQGFRAGIPFQGSLNTQSTNSTQLPLSSSSSKLDDDVHSESECQQSKLKSSVNEQNDENMGLDDFLSELYRPSYTHATKWYRLPIDKNQLCENMSNSVSVSEIIKENEKELLHPTKLQRCTDIGKKDRICCSQSVNDSLPSTVSSSSDKSFRCPPPSTLTPPLTPPEILFTRPEVVSNCHKASTSANHTEKENLSVDGDSLPPNSTTDKSYVAKTSVTELAESLQSSNKQKSRSEVILNCHEASTSANYNEKENLSVDGDSLPPYFTTDKSYVAKTSVTELAESLQSSNKQKSRSEVILNCHEASTSANHSEKENLSVNEDSLPPYSTTDKSYVAKTSVTELAESLQSSNKQKSRSEVISNCHEASTSANHNEKENLSVNEDSLPPNSTTDKSYVAKTSVTELAESLQSSKSTQSNVPISDTILDFSEKCKSTRHYDGNQLTSSVQSYSFAKDDSAQSPSEIILYNDDGELIYPEVAVTYAKTSVSPSLPQTVVPGSVTSSQQFVNLEMDTSSSISSPSELTVPQNAICSSSSVNGTVEHTLMPIESQAAHAVPAVMQDSNNGECSHSTSSESEKLEQYEVSKKPACFVSNLNNSSSTVSSTVYSQPVKSHAEFKLGVVNENLSAGQTLYQAKETFTLTEKIISEELSMPSNSPPSVSLVNDDQQKLLSKFKHHSKDYAKTKKYLPITGIKTLHFPEGAEVFCYVCKKHVNGRDILKHLFFGDLKCSRCDCKINKCKDLEGIKLKKFICNERKLMMHEFNVWALNPVDFLAYRMWSTSREIGKKSSPEEQVQGLSRYLQTLSSLDSVEPWSTALSRCTKYTKSMLKDLKLPVEEIEIPRESNINLEIAIPNLKNADNIQTLSSMYRREKILNHTISDESVGKTTEKPKSAIMTIVEDNIDSKNGCHKILSSSQKLINDDENAQCLGSAGIGANVMPKNELKNYEVSDNACVTASRKNYDGEIITNQDPSDCHTTESASNILGPDCLLDTSYTMDLFEKGMEYVEINDECTELQMNISSIPENNRCSSGVCDPSGNGETTVLQLMNKDTPECSMVLGSTDSAENSNEARNDLKIDERHLIIDIDTDKMSNKHTQHVLEECPMCYEVLCPSQFTVNTKSFTVSTVCTECDLIIIIRPKSSISKENLIDAHCQERKRPGPKSKTKDSGIKRHRGITMKT